MEPSKTSETFGAGTRMSRTDGDARRTRRESFPSLPPRLQPGDLLGGFEVLREIRSGGHSAVFHAVKAEDGGDVALKVLSPQLSVNEGAVERFRTEAELASRVQHPSLIPSFTFGSDAGHYFYAMPLESGDTLEDRAAQQALQSDPSAFVDLAGRFAEVARGVAALHASGIVHRDIKPSNVLVSRDGGWKLSDFGSALDARRRDARLESCPGGTVLYMSPEQLRPGADPYDAAGDVYSLGMTLYELCAGTSPFPHATDSELARLKLTRVPAAPRRLNQNIPLALEAIIREACESSPLLRHATAERLAEDLERFASRKRASTRGRVPPPRAG